MQVNDMPEREEQPIHITMNDVAEANRLSHSCPICANAVENNVELREIEPVVCSNCRTLYHRTCWDQNGGRCATLGCNHESCYEYGTLAGPRLVVDYADLPRHVPSSKKPQNGRFRQLKEQERQTLEGAGFWNRLFRRIMQAAGWR